MPYLFLTIMMGIIDQLVKFRVEETISPFQNIRFIGDYVSLTYVRNYGAAFGLLESQTFFLIAIAGGIILFAWFYRCQLRQYPKPFQIGIALALGGAIGNLVDRVRLGYVIDYIDLHFWPVFNIADIAIVAGVVWIIAGFFTENLLNKPVTETVNDETGAHQTFEEEQD